VAATAVLLAIMVGVVLTRDGQLAAGLG